MKIVVTIAAINPRHGGPPRTVPALCRALAAKGSTVELITVGEGGIRPEISQTERFDVTSILAATTRYRPWSWRKAFCDALVAATRVDGAIVMYDVGLWLPANHFAATIAVRHKIPLMVSPRGMLNQRALRVSGLKKKLGWILYQKSNLRKASVLHAASDAEADVFRERGLRQPIAVISNGIEIPNAQVMQRKNGALKTLLFLSRLDPIKGLPDLIRAWAEVRPRGWRVVIAGPDESNYQKEIRAQVASCDAVRDFVFVGEADDEAKQTLYAHADLFVLPSYSESFGQVVGEALAAGVPVITTHGTPWSDLEEHRCGWWVPTGAAALAQALRKATSLREADLRSMGRRGRQLILNEYSWNAIADQMLGVFRWMHAGGNPPACVRQL